jgi:hypothetical protein
MRLLSGKVHRGLPLIRFPSLQLCRGASLDKSKTFNNPEHWEEELLSVVPRAKLSDPGLVHLRMNRFVEAAAWFSRHAELEPRATYNLALCTEQGWGV